MAFKVTTTISDSAAAKRSSGSGNGHHKSEGPGKLGGGGGGDDENPRGGGDDDNQHDNSARRFSIVAYRVAMAATLAAVVMTFGSLTIVYVFRAGGANWQPVAVPRALWLSSALLILSSFTIEVARKALHRRAEARYQRWMLVTVAFGVAFIVMQLMAWSELRIQGIYLAGNPHSSFFYLLTAAHVVHLLGGIAGACFLLFKLRGFSASMRSGSTSEAAEVAGRREVVSLGALYWHSMDVLWIYIFALLFLWR